MRSNKLSTRKLWVMSMFIILIITVSGVYNYAKTYQIAHFKYVYFIVSLLLNKAVENVFQSIFYGILHVKKTYRRVLRKESESSVHVYSRVINTYCICVSPMFYHFLGSEMHFFLCLSFCTKTCCFSCQTIKAILNPFPLILWNYGNLPEIYLAR